MRGGRKETFKKIFRLCCWQSERADKTYKKKRKIYNLLVVLICYHFKHSLVRGSREVKALIETNAKWSWSGFTNKTRFLISFSMWNPLWCDFKKGEIITFFTITWKCHREMTSTGAAQLGLMVCKFYESLWYSIQFLKLDTRLQTSHIIAALLWQPWFVNIQVLQPISVILTDLSSCLVLFTSVLLYEYCQGEKW